MPIQHSTPHFKMCLDRLVEISNLPFSNFDYSVARINGATDHRMTQPHPNGGTAIVICKRGDQIDHGVITFSIQLEGMVKPNYFQYTEFGDEWVATISGVGRLDHTMTFSRVPNTPSDAEFAGPSAEIVTRCASIHKDVVQRICDRFSRVDLL